MLLTLVFLCFFHLESSSCYLSLKEQRYLVFFIFFCCCVCFSLFWFSPFLFFYHFLFSVCHFYFIVFPFNTTSFWTYYFTVYLPFMISLCFFVLLNFLCFFVLCFAVTNLILALLVYYNFALIVSFCFYPWVASHDVKKKKDKRSLHNKNLFHHSPSSSVWCQRSPVVFQS